MKNFALKNKEFFLRQLCLNCVLASFFCVSATQAEDSMVKKAKAQKTIQEENTVQTNQIVAFVKKTASQKEQSVSLTEKIVSHSQKELSDQEFSSLPPGDVLKMTDESTESSDLPETQKIDGFEASWKAAFKLKHFKDQATIFEVSSTELYGKSKWSLDAISFQIQALVIGRTGFTSSTFDRDDRTRGLHLVEGFFKLEPFSDFFVQVGAIKQDFLEAPLLITDRTFFSLMGHLPLISSSNPNLSLLLQAATTSNVERVKREAESPPRFFTSSILLQWPDFLFQSSIKNIFTLFYYYNLSPDIADKSYMYGNSTEGSGSSAHFTYGFFGWHNNFKIKRALSDFWIWELGGEFLYNFLAPDKRNEGQRYYSSVYHNYEDFVEVKLTGEIFANQPDSSVSYYGSEVYGRNDRKGFLTSLQVYFYNSGLTLGISFVYSRPDQPLTRSVHGNSFSISGYLITDRFSI